MTWYVPAWTLPWGNSEWASVADVCRRVDVCYIPEIHVPEAGGVPPDQHGLRGYLAGAKVSE